MKTTTLISLPGVLQMLTGVHYFEVKDDGRIGEGNKPSDQETLVVAHYIDGTTEEAKVNLQKCVDTAGELSAFHLIGNIQDTARRGNVEN